MVDEELDRLRQLGANGAGPTIINRRAERAITMTQRGPELRFGAALQY
jgi:hypothetical protein